MGSNEKAFFNLEGIPNLLEIKTLVFEKLPIEDFERLNLPQKLPNLRHLQISNCPVKTLEGLPSEMPNLETISLSHLPYIKDLKGFPKKIPVFSEIYLQDLPHISSFKGFPSEFPRLNKLDIRDTNLLTLRDISGNIPPRFFLKIYNYDLKDPILFDLSPNNSFQGFGIQDYIFKNFSFLRNFNSKDMKHANFTFRNCIIHSFEGFPTLPESINLNNIFDRYYKDTDSTRPSILFSPDTKIYSLSGLSFQFLKYILPHYFLNEKMFDFAPHGKKLLENCNNQEYLERTNYNNIKEDFKIENLKPLYEYFKIPIINLAHRYVSDSTYLPSNQIECLIHEADHNIRKILENSLPQKNPVILQISQKIAFETSNGLKIFK